MNDRVTITINRNVYDKLKQKGSFGETYSELILRLIKLTDTDIVRGENYERT
jgi:predicted CopG family antitoxin